MTEIEATQQAWRDLGTQATVPDIVRFAQEQYGISLDARFVPLYLATIRGHEQREQMRQIAAKTALSDS